jgi:hypothetical protein
MKTAITIISILICTGFSKVSKETTFELSENRGEMIITGTSSLHDWEMTLKSINCEVQIEHEGTLLKSLDNISFSCKATDIKSESSLMNKKAYDALKADAFPQIKFNWISTTGLVSEGNNFKGDVTGKLNVAGETRETIVPFNGTFVDNNTVIITGSTELQMSSFKITTPTALLGTLKTGDKISVSFTLQFTQQ